ncbi:hypothetical protein KFX43_10265 [Bacteroides thetaiotaomicron]|uniref:hypothetical protein n=1 Tax=Bacteroides thetaiotaomicron TaxID=818 RepID=UPI001CE2D57E|nr:hypothetical protein [Bacteroides thetaiotaomicron]MCA6012968.1 hypothetical protein [Bacteroides thetaiotaomicron]
MSVIVFIICLISCIASMIGYLRRKYKQRSRFIHGYDIHNSNHYDKRSLCGVHILIPHDVHISPYDVYKLFVGQNKNSDYQQREHDYHWYRFDKYELTSSKKYIFTNMVLCIAMAVMIIHYTFLVMDGVAILEGGYQYIPLLISGAICTNKLITKYKAYKIAKTIHNIYDNMLPQIIERKKVSLSFKYLGEYVTLEFKIIPHSHILWIDEIQYIWGEIDVFIAINNNETRLEVSFYWRKQQ